MAITTPSMGLKRWDQPNDVFSYVELSDNFSLIDTHDHSSGKGVQIPTAGIQNLAVTDTKLAANAVTDTKIAANAVSAGKLLDASIAAGKLDATLAALLGITTGVTRRGKSINPQEDTRTNTAYGTMTNADRVPSVVVPTDGLIAILYQALWKESVFNTARAAIFIGSNQLRIANPGGGSTVTQAAAIDDTTSTVVNVYTALSSNGMGLASAHNSGADMANVTTGQAVGVVNLSDPLTAEINGSTTRFFGPYAGGTGNVFGAGLCLAFATAGTYDITVQFKSSSGTVSVKDRRLWAWTVGF